MSRKTYLLASIESFSIFCRRDTLSYWWKGPDETLLFANHWGRSNYSELPINGMEIGTMITAVMTWLIQQHILHYWARSYFKWNIISRWIHCHRSRICCGVDVYGDIEDIDKRSVIIPPSWVMKRRRAKNGSIDWTRVVTSHRVPDANMKSYQHSALMNQTFVNQVRLFHIWYSWWIG